jgi:hypothetical protein
MQEGKSPCIKLWIWLRWVGSSTFRHLYSRQWIIYSNSVGGRVGHGADMDAVVNRKIILLPEIEPRSSIPYPVTWLTFSSKITLTALFVSNYPYTTIFSFYSKWISAADKAQRTNQPAADSQRTHVGQLKSAIVVAYSKRYAILLIWLRSFGHCKLIRK